MGNSADALLLSIDTGQKCPKGVPIIPLFIPARNKMSISSVLQLRTFLCTFFCRIAAAGTERTAGRHMHRARYITFQNDALSLTCDIRVRDRNRRE